MDEAVSLEIVLKKDLAQAIVFQKFLIEVLWNETTVLQIIYEQSTGSERVLAAFYRVY